MALHLTKVAFGVTSVDHLAERLRIRAETEGTCTITTRYLPKRHAEIVPADDAPGSLFWIHKHQLIARSTILGFGDAEGGRVAITLDPHLVLVHARTKRAHQGWRYLEHADAPRDFGEGAEGLAALPAKLVGELAAVGLL